MNKSKAGCSAFDKAVNLLTFKGRTTYEIYSKLEEKGYSSEEIDDAVCKLSYYGYLNDENYTLSYIRDNASKKGKKLIASELSAKGIDNILIQESINSIDIDEISAIEGIMNKRYCDADLSDDKIVSRMINYFLRRGFSYNNINSVVKRFLDSKDELDMFT